MKYKNDKIDLNEQYKIVEKLISNNKLEFLYYGKENPIEILSIIKNKKDNKIDVIFRNIMDERINELKSLLKNKEIN